MSSSRRTTPRQRQDDRPDPITVIEDTHPFEGHDGRTFWCIGPAPVYEDIDGERHFAVLGDPLPRTRALYCKVAGLQHYAQATRDPRLAPRSPVKLIAEPDNPHDPDAVGVWEGGGEFQAGHVPAELSAEVAARLRSGEQLGGLVLREIREASRSGPRVGLHILIAPPAELEVTILPDC
ncbi:MAG: HIRAN domain-containing protein [Solirubrobacteraceae bacterium]